MEPVIPESFDYNQDSVLSFQLVTAELAVNNLNIPFFFVFSSAVQTIPPVLSWFVFVSSGLICSHGPFISMEDGPHILLFFYRYE